MKVKRAQARGGSGRTAAPKVGLLLRIFPFIGWWKGYTGAMARADVVAGLTVALVLIPQSMAYAQLAGLPAFYGLYAAFLPPMIASLFGSSFQLATGPVAVVSLMTATALEPLATAGSEAFIAYAIVLAVLVGVFQLLLGLFRLGLVVNFLSHPVVNGFTNAAALIIASSQLSKIFGVYVDKAEHHYETIWNVVRAAVDYTHWPTLALAVLAFAIMAGLKKVNPRIPNVLVAVVATTIISWAVGFEHDRSIPLSAIQSPEVGRMVAGYNRALGQMAEASEERTQVDGNYQAAAHDKEITHEELVKIRHRLELLNLRIDELKEELVHFRAALRRFKFVGVPVAAGQPGRTEALASVRMLLRGEMTEGLEDDGRIWRIKLGTGPLDESALRMSGGGAVVGVVPRGLPKLAVPRPDLGSALRLLPMAVIISLLGFMEAISIAKAMAAKTGQRLDPNQELIGQGLGNLIGSFGQSYPVSGSFSRSAVNLQAGGVSGFSNVVSSLIVVITLLFFTPLLYHLPQSVLAAIIMMAVIGLLNVTGFIHAYRAQKYDGIISVISFAATLLFAPHLDRGIIIGVALSVVLYLLRNMKPEVAILSKHPDGSYRDADHWQLKTCDHIVVIRFSGSLIFANVSYLEDKLIDQITAMPRVKHVVLVGNGINELDASGEDILSLLADRLHDTGIKFSLSGCNENVLEVMKRTHLFDKIGEENIYRNVARALECIHAEAHREDQDEVCPLLTSRSREETGEVGPAGFA
jgi:anti-anti-sigma factor